MSNKRTNLAFIFNTSIVYMPKSQPYQPKKSTS